MEKHFDLVESKCSLVMKGERNESQSVCSSVCSCSSSTSFLSLDCCDQSANSSSNRKNRKRKRKIVDMPRKSYVDMLQQVGGDEWNNRTAMRKIWTENKDAYLHHLALAQKNKFGSPNDENFWELFTKAFVTYQKLHIQISPELIESCKAYGLYLQDLSKQCQDIERLEAHRESKETRNILFDIFEKEKLEFKRGTSTRPSGASPPSGKLARSSGASDPSVHMTYPVLKEQVLHVLSDIGKDKHFKPEPLQKFRDHILGDDLLILIFLKYLNEERIDMINEFLKPKN